MPKIKYIPFGNCTGLEVRDKNGIHLFNILPPQWVNPDTTNVDCYATSPCEFTYEELLQAIHKMREGKL